MLRARINLGRPRNRRVPLALAALLAAGVGEITASPPSSTQAATAVQGSAFGVSTRNVTIFGGSQPPYGPTPMVTLPPAGSASAVTASAPSETVMYGPATLFKSGSTSVSTMGTPSGGSVTSSTSIQSTTQFNCLGAATSCIYGGPFTADTVASTCHSASSGNSASTTITNGQLVTATDPDGNPITTIPIPMNPPPNDSIQGFFYAGPNDKETFNYTFNEQTINPDGSITVTAGHERLYGPTLTGDLYFGQAVCGVTGGPTAVRVAAIRVRQQGRVLEMRWRAVNTTGIAGFALFAGQHRLNAHLVRVHRSPRYRYATGWSGTGPYSLGVVLTDGTMLKVKNRP